MTPTRRTLTGGEGAPVEHVQLAMAPCDVTRYVATRVFVFGLVEGKVLETFHCASRLAPADIVTMRPLDYTMQLTALQVLHGSLQGVLRPGTVHFKVCVMQLRTTTVARQPFLLRRIFRGGVCSLSSDRFTDRSIHPYFIFSLTFFVPFVALAFPT